MKIYKITKNGKDLKNSLTEDEANKLFFPLIEDFSNGYHYDNDNETIYHEVDRKIIAEKGDLIVNAGDDVFEIVLEYDI